MSKQAHKAAEKRESQRKHATRRKNPIEEREAVIEEIGEQRARDVKGASPAPSHQQREQKSNRIEYSEEQRNAIAAELKTADEGDPNSLAETIDEIEILVRLTLEVQQYREHHPVADWWQDEFRVLNKPISQILKVLNWPESEHLHEFIPHLRTELNFLLRMVRADQPKGRGRPPDPMKALHVALVMRMAQIWAEYHGHWPRRSYNAYKKEDYGPLHRFVRTCLDPAGIRVSNYTVRKVIENMAINR